MNYCQVELDTERYLNEQSRLEAAQEALDEENLDAVHCVNGEHFWGDSGNFAEAIGEQFGLTGLTGIEFSSTFAMLVRENKGDELVMFLKNASVKYWINFLEAQ